VAKKIFSKSINVSRNKSSINSGRASLSRTSNKAFNSSKSTNKPIKSKKGCGCGRSKKTS